MASGPGRDICGMVIEEMPEDFFGEWKCFFNRDLRAEHQGHFRILTKEEPFVEVNIFLLHYLCLSTVSLSVSVFLSLCLSVSLSFCLSVSLSLCLSVSLSLCLYVSMSLCLSVSLSLCLSVSLSLCLSVFQDLCLYVSLPLFL